jgi:hypothetical protein
MSRPYPFHRTHEAALRPFQTMSEADKAALRNLHRVVVLEQRDGGGRINTHTALALQAQCGLCNGSCHWDQHCPVMNASAPAPHVARTWRAEESNAMQAYRAPSLLQRLAKRWREFIAR